MSEQQEHVVSEEQLQVETQPIINDIVEKVTEGLEQLSIKESSTATEEEDASAEHVEDAGSADDQSISITTESDIEVMITETIESSIPTEETSADVKKSQDVTESIDDTDAKTDVSVETTKSTENTTYAKKRPFKRRFSKHRSSSKPKPVGTTTVPKEDEATEETTLAVEENKQAVDETETNPTYAEKVKKPYKAKGSNKKVTKETKKPVVTDLTEVVEEVEPVVVEPVAKPFEVVETEEKAEPTEKSDIVRNNSFNRRKYNSRHYNNRRVNYVIPADSYPIVIPGGYTRGYDNKNYVAFNPNFVHLPYQGPLSVRPNHSYNNNRNHNGNNNRRGNSNYDSDNKPKNNYNRHSNRSNDYYVHNPFARQYNGGRRQRDNRREYPAKSETNETSENAKIESIEIEKVDGVTHVKELATVAEPSC